MKLYLGIDGGGTRTVAWLVDGEGKTLGRAETGPSNPLKAGFRAATSEISRAFRLCWQESGRPSASRKSSPALLQAVCAGIAGSDRESVHRPLVAWMRQNIPAHRHILTSDAAIALSAALRDSPGIIVISGTGSIAYARDDRGNILRVGGWGIPFDDCGSGYEIGRKAVAAALQAFDGRGPQTKLSALICRQLNLGQIDEVVGCQPDQQQVAALFPLVIEAASTGDRVARRLCHAAARDLVDLAVAVLKKIERTRKPPRVIIAGGVFQSSSMIHRAFARLLRQSIPHAQVEMLKNPPVEGAAWLARNSGRKKS